jgi:transglutaminase-like putative cysteine protease
VSVDSWLRSATVDVEVSPRAEAGRPRRRAAAALAVGVLVGLVAAVLPLLDVIDAGWWLAAAIALAAVVLAAGAGARALRLPGVAVFFVEAVLWVIGMTAMFGGSTALLWVLPTPSTVSLASDLAEAGVQEIIVGAAPLDAGRGLSFLLIAAVGLVAIAIDHVVVTARMPLLAAIGLVTVSLIPSIAVPGGIDLVAFGILAAAILFLLRVDTRERQREAARPRARTAADPAVRSGATATAIGIGVVAVIVAVAATPLLPAPSIRAGSGFGGTGSTIDPTLELGDDLRQPREVEVLTVRSTAPTPPYLRAVTLSQFDGAVWAPDDGRSRPLEGAGDAFPPPDSADDIEVSEYRTTVEILDLNSTWLPVPAPAVAVAGLEGQWGVLESNRTVVTRTGSTQGQSYEVTTSVPRPTLEQLRARAAAGGGDETTVVPDGIPAEIEAVARDVTAGTGNDFDALQTLQAWFRGPEFAYSLDAPVDAGFDGSGAEAVADFLEVREGYCVHFASAFALMARTLGMPSRIVVGYLPGSTTNTAAEGQTVYSVVSSRLHAWPEVHFEGIGWIPFEPTNSLGVPTSYASESTGGNNTTTPGQTPADEAETEDEDTATPTPTAGPRDDEEQSATGPLAPSGQNPWPGVGVTLGVLLLVLAPAGVGLVRRRARDAAASAGNAGAAWTTVREAALDLGIPVPAAESPRAFGERLTRAHGAPAADMDVLVRAIERTSYAPAAQPGAALDAATRAVRAAIGRDAGLVRRAMGALFPRSLVVRPGSAYAGRAADGTPGRGRHRRDASPAAG